MKIFVSHHYDAFISYSHKADSELARVLQARLERWARPWFASRTAKLFRDQVSLTATPHLWTTIAESLDKSRFLILLASTDSAKSEWVPKEIAYWLSEGKCENPEELKTEQVVIDRVDRLMIVLTEGQIDWSHADGDFDWSVTTALHPVLRKLPWQPLWTDLRWARGMKAKQIEADERFTEPVLKLLSPIRGKTPQELLDANDKEQKRAVSLFRRLSIVATALALIAIVLYGLAEVRRLDAEAKTRVATAQRLAAQSESARVVNPAYPQRSMLLAIEAIRATLDHGQSVTSAGEQALHDSFAAIQGRFLTDHNAPIESVVFGANGVFATFGENRTVKVWNRKLGNQTPITLGGKDDLISVTAFAPDGRLVTGGFNGNVKIWKLTSSAEVDFELSGHTGSVTGLVFASDNRLITVSQDHTARVWNLKAPATSSIVLRVPEGMTAIAISPNGELVTGGGKNNVRVWNLDDLGSESVLYPGNNDSGVRDWVESLAFDEDRRVIAHCADGAIRAWRLADHNSLPSVFKVPVDDRENDRISAMAVSPSGHIAAVCDSGGVFIDRPVTWPTVRVWNLNRSNGDPVILRGQKGLIFAITFTPDGRLVSGGQDRLVRLWNMQEPNSAPVVLAGHEGSITTLSIGPEDQLVSGSSDGTARAWDLESFTSNPIILKGHSREIHAVAVAPDGRIVTAGFDRLLRVWDFRKAEVAPVVLRGHEGWVDALAFSPDGRLISCGGYGDNSIRVWNLDSLNETPIVLRGHKESVRAVAFTSDGRLVSVGDGIRIWNLMEPTVDPVVLGRRNGLINSVAWAPDGRLVTGGEKLQVWNLTEPTCNPIDLFGHADSASVNAQDGRQGTHINTLAFSRDHRLITGGNDGTIRLWNYKALDATPVILRGHDGPVNTFAFDRQNRLISAGWDGIVRFWDLNGSTNAPVLQLREPNVVEALVFTSDSRLVTGSVDGMARVWDLEIDRLRSLAAQVTGRNLSTIEWQQFINAGGVGYRKTFENCPKGEGNRQ